MTVLMSGWLSEMFSDFLSDCQAGLGLDRERLGPRDGGVAPLRLSTCVRSSIEHWWSSLGSVTQPLANKIRPVHLRFNQLGPDLSCTSQKPLSPLEEARG